MTVGRAQESTEEAAPAQRLRGLVTSMPLAAATKQRRRRTATAAGAASAGTSTTASQKKKKKKKKTTTAATATRKRKTKAARRTATAGPGDGAAEAAAAAAAARALASALDKRKATLAARPSNLVSNLLNGSSVLRASALAATSPPPAAPAAPAASAAFPSPPPPARPASVRAFTATGRLRKTATAAANAKKTHQRTRKKNTNKHSPARHRFDYLGGSLNLRAERERRRELEERLVATQSAVQMANEEMQPAVGVLLESVGALETGAEVQQRLDAETGEVLDGLQATVAGIKAAHEARIGALEQGFNERLSRLEAHFEAERAREHTQFSKLVRAQHAELALLRSKFAGFESATRKRLDTLPAAVGKIRAELHAMVEPLGARLSVVSQAVGQLDKALFDVDREQLKIKLSIRNDDPSTGSPRRPGGMTAMDAADSFVGTASTPSSYASAAAAAAGGGDTGRGSRSSVLLQLQKDLRALTAEVRRERTAWRKRTEDQACRLATVQAQLDSQTTAQQRANSELHELVARITTVMRGDLGDQLKALRGETEERLEQNSKQLESRMAVKLASVHSSVEEEAEQRAMLNAIVGHASQAQVQAEEALRCAREAAAKIGSVDAGHAARIAQARDAATMRSRELQGHVDALTRRVDQLSSEITMGGKGMGDGLVDRDRIARSFGL